MPQIVFMHVAIYNVNLLVYTGMESNAELSSVYVSYHNKYNVVSILLLLRLSFTDKIVLYSSWMCPMCDVAVQCVSEEPNLLQILTSE